MNTDLLITDTNAELKLTRALEQLRSTAENTRCVHLLLAPYTLHPEARDVVYTLLSTHLDAHHAQVFTCDDGDMFVLGHNILLKNVRVIVAELAELTAKADRIEDLAEVYDLTFGAGRILTLLEQKIDKQKQALADAQEKEKQDAQRRRRIEILGLPVDTSAQNIITYTRATHRNIEVMVVEDDVFSRKLVEKVLGGICHVVALENAQNLVDTYIRTAPHMVFLDINLPDVTGHELVTRILSVDPSAYIVMLSGNADKENILEAINRGAKGFVGKPFAKDKLIDTIRRCPTLPGARAGLNALATKQ